jgi:hypothetical protein
MRTIGAKSMILQATTKPKECYLLLEEGWETKTMSCSSKWNRCSMCQVKADPCSLISNLQLRKAVLLSKNTNLSSQTCLKDKSHLKGLDFRIFILTNNQR